MAPVLHGLELFLLLGGEDGGELRLFLLAESVHLLMHALRREGGVGAQGVDLLLPIREDGLEFGSLIRRQVEAAAEHEGLAMRIRLVVATGEVPAMRTGDGRGRLLVG